MKKITIVNYGMGNHGSIENMLKRIGVLPIIATTKEEVQNAEKLILPGVGFFKHAVNELKERDLWDIMDKKVKTQKIPLLGICLGAQLVAEYSEEGDCSGFGWIKGKVVKFNDSNNSNIKIPHMGWNNVNLKKDSILFNDMYENPRFYFVHSYHFAVQNIENILTTTTYGYEFPSSIENDNIFAVQFHPEKSHKFGIRLFENFIKI
jgi:glutamine amidotransferase